jgi:hypothetical protein
MIRCVQLGREVLDIAAAMVAPGVTTLEIDAVVHEECMKRNAYPSPLGYHMFPRSVCTYVHFSLWLRPALIYHPLVDPSTRLSATVRVDQQDTDGAS